MPPIPDKYRTPGFIERLNRVYHDLEAAEYDARHPEIFALEGRRWQSLVARTNLSANPRALDLGTGTGFVLEQVLAHRSGARMLAVDLSPEMLDRARRRVAAKFPSASVEFRLVTAGGLDVEPGTLDLVTMNSVLHHVPDPAALLTSIAAWLRPGGWLIVAHEPNAAYFANATLRAWTSRLTRWRWYASVYGDPRRYARKAARLLGIVPPRAPEKTLGDRVVEILRAEATLAPEEPFDPDWVGALVDVHIPGNDGAQGGLAGIDPRALSKLAGGGLNLVHAEDYDHLADETHATVLGRILNARFANRFPGHGAHWAAVMQKPA